MKTDDLIREAARCGLPGLTLWPAKDGRWQANVRQPDGGWRVSISSDPIEAIRDALGARPAAPDNGVFD